MDHRERVINKRDQALARARERLEVLERVATLLAERVVARERELRRMRAELAREREAKGSLVPTIVAQLTPPEFGAEQLTPVTPSQANAPDEPAPQVDRVPAASNGYSAGAMGELFEGMVEVEIGPLSDFSQLVGFEDAAGGIKATSEISVKRFTKGRATLAMRLNEPVALLRELEERAPFEFSVRDLRSDRLVLDVDDE